ncbi:MAG: dihydrofolate reductase [Clostridia bacterium]|nr:dihydrofolate reductase [Clostridia bacterium]
MKLIVAVDKKWGIGKNNGLLFDLKLDMKHFVEHTRGKVVVMGANTLKSLPNGMPLKNRTNIVLNPDGDIFDAIDKGYVLTTSLDELLEQIYAVEDNEVYVIGGAMMYHTLLPYCDTAYITKVDSDGEATVFFDDLDSLDNWSCVDEGEAIEDNGHTIRFCTYTNASPVEFKSTIDKKKGLTFEDCIDKFNARKK